MTGKSKFNAEERLRLIRQYGRMYTRHAEVDPAFCFYCGEERTCLDHRPALRTLDAYGVETMRKNKIPLVLLPACTDCNGSISAKPFLLTANDALNWLLDRLERKYERAHAVWTDDEIEELQYVQKDFVKKGQHQHAVLLSRIRFMQQRAVNKSIFPRFIDY